MKALKGCMPKPEGLTHPISHELLTTVLDYDPATGVFRRKCRTGSHTLIGEIPGSQDTQGYFRIYIFGRKYSNHRLAWFYVNGEWPDGGLDHKDRDPTNNAIKNLRLASNSENIVNRIMPNNAIARGVFRSGRWFRARIKMCGIDTAIGKFKTSDEAAHAYNKAAIELHGEFAILNPIGSDK